ncbi:MAG: hypothetical protein IPJ13_25495 [Saprospiraceae bacterium]|nr:hypothetical protein [Saprospiraceae bacterium]
MKKADSILQYEGYPTLKSGYYTKEPQFGNLVRAAHKKGFKIFGYESNGHTNGKEREINQAKISMITLKCILMKNINTLWIRPWV